MDSTHEAGRVCDTEYIAPCVKENHGQVTGIVEVRCLRIVRDETAKKLRKQYEAHEIHHGFREHTVTEPRTDNLTNTITTVQKDNLLMEYTIIASRSRDPVNPTKVRTASDGKMVQRYESNINGWCNTITSVQKDNLLMEIYIIDDLYANREARVYEYASALRSERNGLKVMEYMTVNNRVDNVEYTSIQNDVNMNVKSESTPSGDNTFNVNVLGGVGDIAFGKQYHNGDRVYDKETISPAISASQGNTSPSPMFVDEHTTKDSDNWVWDVDGKRYRIRIRKLTPKCCWRLMGFKDSDFDKAKWEKATVNFSNMSGSESHTLKESALGYYKDSGQKSENIPLNLFIPIKNETFENVSQETEVMLICEKADFSFTNCEISKFMGMIIAPVDKDTLYIALDKKKPERIFKITCRSSKTLDFNIILALYREIITNKLIDASVYKMTISFTIHNTETVKNRLILNLSDMDLFYVKERTSNSQLYKQAGNAIVKQVLMSVFSQMGLGKGKKWNDMSVEERYKFINDSRKD